MTVVASAAAWISGSAIASPIDNDAAAAAAAADADAAAAAAAAAGSLIAAASDSHRDDNDDGALSASVYRSINASAADACRLCFHPASCRMPVIPEVTP